WRRRLLARSAMSRPVSPALAHSPIRTAPIPMEKTTTRTPKTALDSDQQAAAGEHKRPSRLLELALRSAKRSQSQLASVTIIAGLVAVVGTLDFLAGV